MASQAAYCAAKAGMTISRAAWRWTKTSGPMGPGMLTGSRCDRHRHAGPAARRQTRPPFPDRQNFANLKTGGQLTSPADAATRVLAWLERADFGTNPVADVRDA